MFFRIVRYTFRVMARVTLTAKARMRANKRRVTSALRNAGMPLLVDNRDGIWRLYFIGTDDTGVELELILVPHATQDWTWVCIHAMPTKYRKGGAQ